MSIWFYVNKIWRVLFFQITHLYLIRRACFEYTINIFIFNMIWVDLILKCFQFTSRHRTKSIDCKNMSILESIQSSSYSINYKKSKCKWIIKKISVNFKLNATNGLKSIQFSNLYSFFVLWKNTRSYFWDDKFEENS